MVSTLTTKMNDDSVFYAWEIQTEPHEALNWLPRQTFNGNLQDAIELFHEMFGKTPFIICGESVTDVKYTSDQRKLLYSKESEDKKEIEYIQLSLF